MLWRNFTKRLVGSALVLFLASFLTFAMLDLAPGDAAQIAAGENATPEQIEQVRQDLGLNDPFILRYFTWLIGIFNGDLGFSYISNRPVTVSLLDAAPITLSLALVTMAVSAIIGVTMGALAGTNRGTWIDKSAGVLATLGLAMPSFWVGLLLVSIFALSLSVFPATGYVPLGQDPLRWLLHLLLPAIALGSTTAAEIMRQTRSGVSDVLSQPFIRTARSKGVRGFPLMKRHVTRNAAIPVITVLGLQFGQLFGGVIVVEQVFALPGLGTLAIGAVLSRDLPVIQGYILITATVIVVVNLLVDISYRFIDPKVSS